MMRIFNRSFLLGLAMALLLAGISAVADVPATDEFCTSFDGCTAGNDYVFMLLKPGTNANAITAESLLFIDQYTAEADRFEVAVVFPDFTACEAMVSGEFNNGASSPRRLGSYTASRLPEELVQIDEEAFAGASFTHVYLGERVSQIEPQAFAGCKDLKYIYIPSSVTSIAQDAFSGTPNVIIGCMKGSVAESFALNNGMSYRVLNR